MSKEENKTDPPETELPVEDNESNAKADLTPNETTVTDDAQPKENTESNASNAKAALTPNKTTVTDDAQPKEHTDLPPDGKLKEKEHNMISKSGSLGTLLYEEIDKKIPETSNVDVKKDEAQSAEDNNMAKKLKTSDEILDEIIDDEMNKMKSAGKKDQDGKETSEEDGNDSKGKEGQADEEAKDAEKGMVSVADDIYPGNYCLQDDVRFLKFVSNLNEQPCTCNAAGNDFVLDDFGTNCHKHGCPSSLSAKDIESIKVIFLVRHLPVCKRFLTQNERQVLKNVLKTAPYYQLEFFNRHYPYEIQSNGQDLIQDHMVDERKFPKKDDQKDMSRVKKNILDTLRDNLKATSPVADGNQDRFPVEDYKFGEKYPNRPKERPIDINDHPYDKPQAPQTPSQNQRNKNNAEIMDERLILNLLNDVDAWNCFTSVCICDIIRTEDGCSTESDNNQLKAALLEGVTPEQRKVLSGKIDQALEYFDDLIKARLKEKIEREREYMQILCDGKLKKEELFAEILFYKNKKNVKKNQQEVSMMVNDMFRELIRNNKDIGRDMENKLKKENEFMERDIFNKMKLKMASDLKLGRPKNQIMERYLQDVLHDKFNQEYDLIKSELEFELEKCDEKSLRLLQDLLNQMNKDRIHEYDNINEYFKALYPPTEKPPSPYSGSSASADDRSPPRVPSPDRPRGKLRSEEKTYSRDREPEYRPKKPTDNVEDMANAGKSRQDKEPRGTDRRDPRLQEPDRRESRDPRLKEQDKRDPRLQEPDRPESRDPRLKEQDKRDPRLEEPERRDPRLQEPDRPESRDPRLKEQDKRDPRLQEPDRRESRDPRMREKSRPQKYETPAETAPPLDQHDSHTQTTPSKQRPKSLSDEIDRLMEELWNDSQDKADLIRQLVNELKRYDLNDQNPQEKSLQTKKSYKDFKDEMEEKMKPRPSDRRSDGGPSSRPVRRVPSEPIRAPNNMAAENVLLTLFDEAFQYFILELPMEEQKIELYHDAFHAKRKTVAEIYVLPEARQIRTDVEMKT